MPLLEKIKVHYRNRYDMYMLSAPLNQKGQPMPPSRQLCTAWTVEVWNEISERLIQKSWEVCGYKSINDLQNIESSINRSIIKFDRATMVQMMESAGGSDVIPELDDPKNDIDDPDTEEHTEGTWDITSE